MFDESLHIARRNGDALTTAHAQTGLALLASRGGDAQAAATLHALADAIHEQLGTVTVGLEARLRDADIARLREALGDTAFETAHAQAHSPEQTPWPSAPNASILIRRSGAT
jgi:hypothetical protein